MASLTAEYMEQISGLYRDPVNFSMGIGGGQMQFGGGISLAQTSETGDMHKSAYFKPQLYYDELKNYAYLNTLVNFLRAPIAEGLDQIVGQIKVMPVDPDSPLQKDASIIINNFFEKCNFKQFIKDHLSEFILRGSFMAYIDYKKGRIIDVVDPYDFFMIYTKEGCTWLIPNESNKRNNMIMSGANLMGDFVNFTNQGVHGMFANMFIRYVYGQEVVSKQSREMLESAKSNPEMLANIKAILGGDIDLDTNQKLTEETKKRLDAMTVLYSIIRPVSLLEPYLKKLFTLSIKEMVFDMLSLLQYLKADVFTVTLRTQVTSDTGAAQIVNNVKNLLNRYNIEFINSFEDPSGIVRRVYDKLINRATVIPMADEASDIQMLNIPDIESRLGTLYQDIIESKRTIADEAGIAQESLSGGANRWEAISRNEKMALNIMYLKSTIENFVKETACTIFFNHSNESLWDYKYNNKEMPTTFHFADEWHTLTQPNEANFSESVNGILYGVAADPSIKDGNRVGITVKPTDFEFVLNLSTVLDSYASKTKEGIINETMQSITGVMDSLKSFANYMDIINPAKASQLLESLISIGNYTSNIVDPEKLKNLFTQQPQEEQPPQEEDMGYDMPAYFNKEE